MIGYTMVGTEDLERAKAFYDPLFTIMGLAVRFEDEQVVCWGSDGDETITRFYVCRPFDGETSAAGNGTMTAFRVKTASLVDQLYQEAMSSGASDEGEPGFRPERYGDRFYVSYLRDLDGNKIAFACYDGISNP